MDRIPDHLDIPVSAAAAISFVDGKVRLSARDIAWAIAIGWLAGKQDDYPTQVVVADNTLRSAFGLSARDTIARNEDRIFRLRDARFMTPAGDEVALPTLPVVRTSSGEGVLRGSLDRTDDEYHLAWNVDPGFLECFRAREAEDYGYYDENAEPAEATVMLPTAVLAAAKHRATVQVMLRCLAWTTGVLGDLMVEDDPGRFVVKFDTAFARRMFDVPASMEPNQVMRLWFEPACREISALEGYGLSIVEERVRYKGGRLGKLMGYRITFDYPAEQPEQVFPAPRDGRTWRKTPHKPRVRIPRTRPAPVANVVRIPKRVKIDAKTKGRVGPPLDPVVLADINDDIAF